MSHPALGRTDVQAFVADARGLAYDDRRLARAVELMSADERARLDRFRHEDDRLMFAMGRLMARTLVGRVLGVEAGAWRWREGPHGRPEIDDPDAVLRFNLSHSAGLVICALGLARPVGVDVENLNRRAPDPAIVPRYCSPAEVDDVRSHGDRWRDRFLMYWTLKEAYLKACGLGISVPLSDISFTLENGRAKIRFEGELAGTDDRWAFYLWQPTPRHLAAIATGVGDGAEPEFSVLPF